MIAVDAFAGRAVVVFGLGGSGLKAVEALVAGGAHVLASDDTAARRAEAAALGAEAVLPADIDFGHLSALVLAPGVPLTHPAPHPVVHAAKAAGVSVIGDIELFAMARRAANAAAPLVAITGTNGKSTTTALIAHVLSALGQDTEMGGNIGRAALDLAPFADGRHYVLECSSFQIDLAPTLDADVGILLNLTEDHLDRHGTMDHYAAVKARLVHGVRPGGTAVIGIDDPWSAAIANDAEAAGRSVTRLSVDQPLEHGIFLSDRRLMRAADGQVRPILDLYGIDSLRGAHNAQNAAAAVATVLALGLPETGLQAAFASFPGLEHRMELVRRIGPVRFVNDSKATNADAAAHALASFDHIFWIAGGRAKTGGIAGINKFFPKIGKAYLIGEAAPAFAAELEGAVETEIAGTLDKAVAAAARDAARYAGKDGVVLLSPACASFDQYRSFAARGDAFRDLVNGLPGETPNGES